MQNAIFQDEEDLLSYYHSNSIEELIQDCSESPVTIDKEPDGSGFVISLTAFYPQTDTIKSRVISYPLSLVELWGILDEMEAIMWERTWPESRVLKLG